MLNYNQGSSANTIRVLVLMLALAVVLAACSKAPATTVEAVTINESSLQLPEGGEIQLTATLTGDVGVEAELAWVSSDPSIASVTEDTGYLTAVSLGEAKVSVSSPRFPHLTDEITVQVLPPTEISELQLTSFSVKAELNQQLRSTVTGRIDEDKIQILLSEDVDPGALIPSFTSGTGELYLGDTVQKSGVTVTDFGSQFEYTLRSWDGLERTYTVDAIVLDELRNVVPHFHITTDSGDPITSKTDRVPATLTVEGFQEYEDIVTDMEIRGRGNTSWTWPKKPYQLKLDSKLDLLGLPRGKKWILLSNWGEKSLMGNAIAMKLGRLLGMPFTHHIIPVDVTINGEFMGSYMLTEHKEVKENRIDLPALGADPVYLEFSPHNKEKHYQFTSPGFGLGVTIRYPKLKNVAENEIDATYDPIVEDFSQWEALVRAPDFPENGYRDSFDIESLARFLLVNMFADNYEISRPNSVFLYRVDGIYHMGPLWDFDAGWGMKDGETFANPQSDTLSRHPLGQAFFYRLMEDPAFQEVFEAEWVRFKTEIYSELVSYMRGYSMLLHESYDRDYDKWRFGLKDFDLVVSQMFDWFDARMEYLDESIIPQN